MCYQLGVVSLLQHRDDLGGQEAIMGVTSGGEETPLNMLRPCGMEVPPNGTLDINESLHLIIDYLQKNKCGRHGVIVP